jgi:hypothetical protein
MEWKKVYSWLIALEDKILSMINVEMQEIKFICKEDNFQNLEIGKKIWCDGLWGNAVDFVCIHDQRKVQ